MATINKILDISQGLVCKHVDLFVGCGIGLAIGSLLSLTIVIALF
jgi:hypothetical protein